MGTTKNNKKGKKSDAVKGLTEYNGNATLEVNDAINFGGEKEQMLNEQIALLTEQCKSLRRANAAYKGENTKLRSKISDLETMYAQLKKRTRLDGETNREIVKDLQQKVETYKKLAERPWWKVLLGLGKSNNPD